MQAQLSGDTYALLHQIKGQIDRLCQSEASRRSLLKSLSEISTYMAGELSEFPEEQERQEFIHELKTGDEVRVHSLDSVGILSEVDPQTQKATISIRCDADDRAVGRCRYRLENEKKI